jgi:hypothetical protein
MAGFVKKANAWPVLLKRPCMAGIIKEAMPWHGRT